MFVGSELGAGEQRGGVDQIVEVVDDDRAVLFEEGVPSRGGAGELAGMGDDVALGAFGAAGTENQHAFAVGNRAIERGGESLRLLRRRFDIGRDDIDLRDTRLDRRGNRRS